MSCWRLGETCVGIPCWLFMKDLTACFASGGSPKVLNCAEIQILGCGLDSAVNFFGSWRVGGYLAYR